MTWYREIAQTRVTALLSLPTDGATQRSRFTSTHEPRLGRDSKSGPSDRQNQRVNCFGHLGDNKFEYHHIHEFADSDTIPSNTKVYTKHQ